MSSMGSGDWTLYGVMHRDSPFSFTSGGNIVAQGRRRRVPRLTLKELTRTQSKDLRRHVGDFLRNKNARTGLIHVFTCPKAADDHANQCVTDGKKDVTRFQVYVPPRNRQRRSSPIHFGQVNKLTELCNLEPYPDIQDHEFVVLRQIPAEYIVGVRAFY